MLDLSEIDFIECDSCRAKPGTPLLCKSCYHNRDMVGTLKEEIEDLRAHMLAVYKAAGIENLIARDLVSPILHETVLEAVREHRKAWEQAQALKRLSKILGVRDRLPLDNKTQNKWAKEDLRRIKKIEKKILDDLTPKELKVLEKRMGVKVKK